MKERILSKGLVVGVIILFVGVAVHPATADNAISSDSEEDCDLCQPVRNLNHVRLRNLINRFENLNIISSIVSKNNPELVEEYQKLSDRITIPPEENKEYVSELSWNFPIYCGILEPIFESFATIGNRLIDLMVLYEENPILLNMVYIVFLPIFIITSSIFILGVGKCWDWHW